MPPSLPASHPQLSLPPPSPLFHPVQELPYSALHRPGAAGFGTRTATGTKGVKPLTDAGRAAKAATALGASGFHRCEPSKMPVPAGLPSTQKRVSSRLGRSGAATGTGKLQMQ